jgi:hypothetical protein
MFVGKNKSNMKSRFAMDLKARCVAELYQAFKAHKGQLFEVKKHMPNGGDISPQYLYFAALMPHCRVYYLGIQKLFFYF